MTVSRYQDCIFASAILYFIKQSTQPATTKKERMLYSKRRGGDDFQGDNLHGNQKENK